MIGTIVAAGVLLLWLFSAVRYILKKKKNARKSGEPGCIGCSGGSSCCCGCGEK
ncbi:FeoB-associated Cys-rich membrane protein [Treponema sp.]|uniref:FeoB-associated Cys-rich membrane protein n=1 Tax=Treponema sp. TaxID=166 RepID=UPI003EFF4026